MRCVDCQEVMMGREGWNWKVVYSILLFLGHTEGDVGRETSEGSVPGVFVDRHV